MVVNGPRQAAWLKITKKLASEIIATFVTSMEFKQASNLVQNCGGGKLLQIW